MKYKAKVKITGGDSVYGIKGMSLDCVEAQEIVPVKEDKNNKCECGETVCRYWHPNFCGFCGRKLLWY